MEGRIADYLERFGLAELIPVGLQHAMQLKAFRAGERLFSQGEKADTVYFLVEGKLKISMLSPEGKRLILAFKTPFDIVGDIEYIQHCPFINTVEAVMDTVVIHIPNGVLQKEMADNTAWLQFLLETITRKFEVKSRAMNFNLLYSVDVRVASYLLSMTPAKPARIYTNRRVSNGSWNIISFIRRHSRLPAEHIQCKRQKASQRVVNHCACPRAWICRILRHWHRGGRRWVIPFPSGAVVLV